MQNLNTAPLAALGTAKTSFNRADFRLHYCDLNRDATPLAQATAAEPAAAEPVLAHTNLFGTSNVRGTAEFPFLDDEPLRDFVVMCAQSRMKELPGSEAAMRAGQVTMQDMVERFARSAGLVGLVSPAGGMALFKFRLSVAKRCMGALLSDALASAGLVRR